MQFVVIDSAAHMPASIKAPYRHVAVIEMADTNTPAPKLISDRPLSVNRIVRQWCRLSAKGRDNAFSRAMTEARALAAGLNEGRLEVYAGRVVPVPPMD